MRNYPVLTFLYQFTAPLIFETGFWPTIENWTSEGPPPKVKSEDGENDDGVDYDHSRSSSSGSEEEDDEPQVPQQSAPKRSNNSDAEREPEDKKKKKYYVTPYFKNMIETVYAQIAASNEPPRDKGKCT